MHLVNVMHCLWGGGCRYTNALFYLLTSSSCTKLTGLFTESSCIVAPVVPLSDVRGTVCALMASDRALGQTSSRSRSITASHLRSPILSTLNPYRYIRPHVYCDGCCAVTHGCVFLELCPAFSIFRIGLICCSI